MLFYALQCNTGLLEGLLERTIAIAMCSVISNCQAVLQSEGRYQGSHSDCVKGFPAASRAAEGLAGH